MASGGRPWQAAVLAGALLLAVVPGCKREDPRIRALTVQAAHADEAAQELRQAWRAQFRRFGLAGMKDLRFDRHPLRLSAEQKRALEARVRLEKDSSRRGLLQEILDQDQELQALSGRLKDLQAALPPPVVAGPHDSHYGLALRFLKGQGESDEQARQTLSHVALEARLLPGHEVYHFYLHGEYGTWVSQGGAPLSPRELASRDLAPSAEARDAARAEGLKLRQELDLLESQKQLIEQEVASMQAERVQLLEGRSQLQSERDLHLAQLNALHYLVGVRDTLEAEGIIEVPLLGKDHSGRNWRDAVFTQHLDLRTGSTLTIRARDLGLRRIGSVSVVPGSYLPDEHYRLTLSGDRQTATVELLALSRFRNDKVVFAVVE